MLRRAGVVALALTSNGRELASKRRSQAWGRGDVDKRPWVVVGIGLLLMAACRSPSPSAGQEPRIRASDLPACQFRLATRCPTAWSCTHRAMRRVRPGPTSITTAPVRHTSDTVTTSPEGVVTIGSTGEECQLPHTGPVAIRRSGDDVSPPQPQCRNHVDQQVSLQGCVLSDHQDPHAAPGEVNGPPRSARRVRVPWDQPARDTGAS